MAFITTTVKDWEPIFANEKCALAALGQLQETLAHYPVSLMGYVLMPSHIHLLLGFPEIGLMSTFMKSFKRMSARRMEPLIDARLASKFDYADSFRLWKPRFDDVIIESEKQFKVKLEYIHNNPVKAGLVERAEDFPYSSAKDWLTDKKGLLGVDRKWTYLKDN